MRIFTKIVFMIIIALVGLVNAFLLGEEIYREYDHITTVNVTLFTFSLLFLLSTFSFVFHLKSLKFLKKSKRHNMNTNDSVNIIDSNYTNESPILNSISIFFWIANILYGITILILGIILLIDVSKHAGNVSFLKDWRYVVILGILSFGFWLIIDEWKLKKQNRYKTENNRQNE